MPSLGAMTLASTRHAKEKNGRLQMLQALATRYMMVLSTLCWFSPTPFFKPYLVLPAAFMSQIMLQWATSGHGGLLDVLRSPSMAFFPPNYSMLGMHCAQGTSRPRWWYGGHALRVTMFLALQVAAAMYLDHYPMFGTNLCNDHPTASTVPAYINGAWVSESRFLKCEAELPWWSNKCIYSAANECDFVSLSPEELPETCLVGQLCLTGFYQQMFIWRFLQWVVMLSTGLMFPVFACRACSSCANAQELSAEERAAILEEATSLDQEAQEKGRIQKADVSVLIFLDVFLNLLHYLLSAKSVYVYFTTGNPMFGLVLAGAVAFGYKRQSDVGGLLDLIKEAVESHRRGMKSDRYILMTMRRQSVESLPSMMLQSYSMIFVMHRGVHLSTVVGFEASVFLSIRGVVNLAYDELDLGIEAEEGSASLPQSGSPAEPLLA